MGLYTTLDASRREIRLLRVLPCRDDDDDDGDADPPRIACELSVHRLDHHGTRTITPYTALSYVWGPEPPTTTVGPDNTITVNGEVLPARENLLAALRAFRRRRGGDYGGGGGYIWVDAVCINQGDREEKTTQIPLMGDIYGQAAQTVIWLGEAEGDSDLAMETLDNLDQVDFEAAVFSEEQGRRWRAVMALLQRSWWTRTWIMQEAFLSPNPITWCGSSANPIPFSRFVALKERYDTSYWRGQARWLPYPLFQNVPFTSCLSNWRLTKAQLARDGPEGGDTPFSWIATTSHRLACTEPLDRVYGVLGLCSAEDRAAIVADYDRDLRDVLVQVARRAVPALGLLPLSFVGPARGGGRARGGPLGLPTWVPDLTALDDTQRVNGCVGFHAALPLGGAEHRDAWASLSRNADRSSKKKNEEEEEEEEEADYGFVMSYHSKQDNKKKDVFCIYGCVCDVVTYADAMPVVPQYTGYDADLAAENKAERARVSVETFRRWEALAVDGHHHSLRSGTRKKTTTTTKPPPLLTSIGKLLKSVFATVLGRGSESSSQPQEERDEEEDIYAALPGGRKEAFWRALSCDSRATQGSRPLPSDYGERYEALLGRRRPRSPHSVPPSPPTPPREKEEEEGEVKEEHGWEEDGWEPPMKDDWVRAYAVHAVAKCVNKAFFLTRLGRIGVGVRGVKEGDVVVVAKGGEVPYVVRMQQGVGNNGDGTLDFLGEAYVHGVMDGEAVVEAVRMGRGVVKFYLR